MRIIHAKCEEESVGNSPSSCSNSLFSLIAFACSKLIRPVIPSSASSLRKARIWSEGRSAFSALKNLDQTLRTPQATTKD